jgi:hypothetical protein
MVTSLFFEESSMCACSQYRIEVANRQNAQKVLGTTNTPTATLYPKLLFQEPTFQAQGGMAKEELD